MEHVRYSDPHSLRYLTVFNIFGSDTTDGGSVVGDFLPRLDILVVDAVAKVVHDGNSGQDAVLATITHTHHLTIHADDFGSSEMKRKNY